MLIGFIAQVIDGALGMAYGVSASSLLLGVGVPPAVVSSTVHAAECFTTGASAISHRAFGNVNKALFLGLLIPGVVGAFLGAYILTMIDGDLIKPYIAGYLLIMGIILIVKAFRAFPSREVTTHLKPLAFFGAFVDAVGGGGWGPIVGSTLMARGSPFRETVGTVNTVEFFVTLSASLGFLIGIGLSHWNVILGLAAGGVVAAPIGAWVCKHVPHRPFLVVVGLVVIGLSLRTLILSFS
ncbi:sulfite exporter TauE/SafE family protein [Prosthecobacter sp. SYSU 5D2]|uniref:sulfite exporter TauE/SafE family protein n=1 Tax=Prosthecobacter sp. SYSU 5D2 TaxID=3134134 RepID=UPI0031FE5370